ncbi:MAG TPA: hypothetical protein PLB12_11235 [Candidatus Goldiibacteriota bacterium]|nr:hypothetical protein [Candidatus Goldiibacteriota bacterium]
MTFIILAGIGALVAGVFARNEYKIRKHVKKENLITLSEVVKQEYNLPNDFKFSHNSQDFDNNLNGYYKKLHAQTAAFSVIGESAWYGGEILHNILSVDQNIYDAMSHVTGSQLDSISDLHSATENWAHALGGGFNDGVITSMQGHVAEQVVADHLREAGHDVVFPDTANQQGYDMYVDGIPYNVKNVSDMNTINEHFEKNPDIGVITHHEIDGLPSEHFEFDPSQSIDQIPSFDNAINGKMLVADHALNHDAVIQQTDAASDAITGNVDLHFPFITALLSSAREIAIINRGHTSLENSIKNVGLDIAGTGGGAALGAKGGAITGAFVAGPVGAAVGGIVGAFFGGMTGRKLSDELKLNSYKNAEENYKSNVNRYNDFVNSYQINYRKYRGVVTGTETKRLNAIVVNTKRIIDEKIAGFKQEENEIFTLSNADLLSCLNSCNEILYSQRAANDRDLAKRSFNDKYVRPSRIAIELINVKRLIVKKQELLLNVQKRINDVNDKATQTQRTLLCLEALCLAGFEDIARSQIKKNKAVTEKNREAFEVMVRKQKDILAAERAASFDYIQLKLNGWVKKQVDMMTVMIESLKDSQKQLTVEASKLGFIK